MKLENKSTATLERIKDDLYVVQYGTIKRGSEKIRTLVLTDEGKILKHSLLLPSCGCLKPTFEQITPAEIELNISYNTNLVGTFSKSVDWKIISGKDRKTITIKIKGEVIQ